MFGCFGGHGGSGFSSGSNSSSGSGSSRSRRSRLVGQASAAAAASPIAARGRGGGGRGGGGWGRGGSMVDGNAGDDHARNLVPVAEAPVAPPPPPLLPHHQQQFVDPPQQPVAAMAVEGPEAHMSDTAGTADMAAEGGPSAPGAAPLPETELAGETAAIAREAADATTAAAMEAAGGDNECARDASRGRLGHPCRNASDNSRTSQEDDAGRFMAESTPSSSDRSMSPSGSMREGCAPSTSNPHPLREFSYAQLKEATGRFSRKRCVGEGGFGVVFVGELSFDPHDATGAHVSREDGGSGRGSRHEGGSGSGRSRGGGGTRLRHVAIKKMKQATVQGYEGFVKEVTALAQLTHPNLIRLYGFCKDQSPMLVFELMAGGSLEKALRDNVEDTLYFSWEARLKVAVGAARGLSYMHSCNFIHRDIKASNVLLDTSYNAKLTDFGLVRVGPDKKTLISVVSTRVMGTPGYIDPSYMHTGRLGSRSDVYSFGVLLSELLTGRMVLANEEERSRARLLDAIRAAAHAALWNPKAVVDSKLEGEFDSQQARTLALLVGECTVAERRDRPAMSHVCRVLEELYAACPHTIE